MNNLFNPDDLIACICEGSSEKTIMEILLDQDALVFGKEQLLNEDIIVGVNSGKFTDSYLGLNYGNQKITILIISDRTNWKKIRSPYNQKISSTLFFLTKPELEMLMIHSLNLYDSYNKTKLKPSVFLSNNLKKPCKTLKQRNYIQKFYSNHSLLEALRTYKQKSPKSNQYYTIADLLRSDC